MTIERAKHLAEQWSSGGVCSLREGEAEEYHKMFYDMLCKDTVEVVRCKDCKWGKAWRNAFGISGFKCDLLCVDLSPEAFCSYGKRKEGAD